MSLLDEYRVALRREPHARSYLGASLIDDVGTVIAGWAGMLLMTNLFTSQRERAKLMIPSLFCLLVGTILSGPLADWVASDRVARWRWQIVLVGRGVETAFLGLLVVNIARGEPTLARVLPYVLVSSFMKTALRSTRVAFSVDLLRCEQPQTDADGTALRDERGRPLVFKTHLLTFASLGSSAAMTASLVGLLAGGQVMRLSRGAYWPLFLADVLTNLAFIVIVLLRCRPEAGGTAALPQRVGVFRHFGRTVRDGVRFLAQPSQRPLLGLLAGAWVVELVAEAYDGKMIVKQVLGGSDDAVRYTQLVWQVAALLVVVALPMATRCVRSIGKVFFLTMLFDCVAVSAAGWAAGHPGGIALFALAGGIDHSLTMASTQLTEVAQASATSAGMRGRVDAVYVFAVLLGDMVVEAVAAPVAESIGIPAMLVRLGVIQLGVVVLIAVLGRKRLWNFGVFAADGRPSTPSVALEEQAA